MPVTRDDIRKAVLALNSRNILFEACTGLGKTRIGLTKALSLCDPREKILVVVPKIVLIDEWKKEIQKWGQDVTRFKFMCYQSFIRKSGFYACIILDEAHHATTDACLEAIKYRYNTNHWLLLTATMPKKSLYAIQQAIPKLDVYSVPLVEAVEQEILPEPEYLLMSLDINSIQGSFPIIKHPSAKEVQYVPFGQRFQCKDPKIKYIIQASAAQKISYIQGMCEFFQSKGNSAMYKIYCSKRLKAYAEFKTELVKNIRNIITKRGSKVLIFTSDIAQADMIGNAYHSKKSVKTRENTLEEFNNQDGAFMSVCGCIDEGVNLHECQYGIFTYIPAGQVKQVQRTGRCLRHNKPYIIVPYFKDSREEQIVKDMTEGFKTRVITFNDLIKGV